MAGSLTRSDTDIIRVGGALSTVQLKRERSFMKSLGIWLCVAFTVWMVACGLLLVFAGDIARFMIEHGVGL